ncbi:MAG: acyl-CoA carboxylase subunit epsilon [Streptosporangiales bacterium]|nr:acyl-CoA carboxylase subunit epsilon [Streptosporangiales bacterium]MBO0891950.1 acyl-CoA carboxylase subunit epsilon [Acidothermales bacterium]
MPEADRPLLRVVRGDPSPEELAALVTVVAARRAAGEPPRPPRSRWADPAARMRHRLAHGRDAWRTSTRPG